VWKQVTEKFLIACIWNILSFKRLSNTL